MQRLRSAGTLEVRSLSINYATPDGVVPVVRDVSFTLEPGEALGLVGESGSGKSTIAGAILGLLPANASVRAAAISLGDHDLQRLSSRARRRLLGSAIGAVFQDPFSSLNPSLPVGFQIAEPLIQHKRISRAHAKRRVLAILEELGIPDSERVYNAYPHQLSGGMRQRAMIATAITCEPLLLVLDEPTTALDVTIQKQILDLLAGLRRTRDLSYLFVSHDLNVISDVCEKVCVLYGGEVVEYGPNASVLGRPRHPYTKGLLAAAPRLDVGQSATRSAGIPGDKPDLSNLREACIFHLRCPFAEQRCRSESQVLLLEAGERQVRCWKNESIADQDWPHSSVPTKRINLADASPLISGIALSKTFGGKRHWRFPVMRLFPKDHKSAGQLAVNAVTLTIRKGEVLGLVGESGSGKSTLGRILVRLIEPSSGTLIFENKEIDPKSTGPDDFRRRVQVILQNPDSSLNPRHTVRQIVSRPIRFFGLVQANEVESRSRELLKQVQLDPAYLDRYPSEISGGERQRVSIARALASEPEFIICDEAVSALDVAVQATVVNLLKDLQQSLGLSYLFISHDLALVSQISDRIAVMQNGRLREIGLTHEVLAAPFHPYTADLLRSLPHRGLDGRHFAQGETLTVDPGLDGKAYVQLSHTHLIFS